MNNTHIRAVIGLVLTHALVNVAHAAAHIGEDIALPLSANAFVVLVILIAPFLALGLLYTRYQRVGAWLLLAAMLGALLFGLANHIVLPGPDNIMQADDGPWKILFQTSALLLAVIEMSGAVIGGQMLYSLGRSAARDRDA